MGRAAKELQVEPKTLTLAASAYLQKLPWPGNVRQLENTCRWITVMATGREVLVSDLPPELQAEGEMEPDVALPNWEQALAQWARQALQNKSAGALLDQAVPAFERVMITEALQFTGGRRRDAAVVLGWGRNTLTRKLKELGLSTGGDDDD